MSQTGANVQDLNEKYNYDGVPVCVTGGAGFIGSHLIAALVNAGAIVRVIDDFSNGREENLADVSDRITLVRGSILDEGALREAAGESKIIFHLAAMGSVPRSIEAPLECHAINSTGTLNVLEAARRAGADRVVYSASSSAYGNQSELPLKETMTPDPLSPYAASKLYGELLVRAYACSYGLSGVSLRYFNIFGPRQRPDSPYAAVIPAFADALLSGRRPVIYGDGEQTRDFTDVSNAVRANLLAGRSENELSGEAVNIACGEGASINTLLQAIANVLELPADCEYVPSRAGEVMHSLASIEAARSLIGYEPVTTFADGLARALEHYRRT